MPVALYKILRGHYREGLAERVGVLPDDVHSDNDKQTIWVHAASVGETLAAASLVEQLKEEFDCRLVFSTMTDTGREVARKNVSGIDHLIHIPLDLSPFVRKAVRAINPDLLIMIETELWPNLIKNVRDRGGRVMLASGRISDDSFKGYRYLGPLLKKTLSRINLMAMQQQLNADRIRELGAPADRVLVTGNIKYDRQFMDIDRIDLKQKQATLDLDPEEKLIIAGSTHDNEEEQLIYLARRLQEDRPDTVFLIAPRYVDRASEIKKMYQQAGFAVELKTEIVEQGYRQAGIIILDTMGELTDLFPLADLVFIGGSLIDRGGHKIMEPAACGRPVLFGTSMYNFKEEKEFILENEAGIQVANIEELTEIVFKLLNNPRHRQEMGQRARQVIQENRGATSRTLNLLKQLLHGEGVEPE
ncbi:MAG: 3-deoxy-D-manno-octulosonic acid transferase [Bacillota bacterium]